MEKLSILLVDTSADFLGKAATCLQLLPGVERVDMAACGLDALHDAAAGFPELVFVNISLPDMSGLEVIRRLKRLIPAPEVVALLSDNHSEFRIAAATWGADGCLARTEFFDRAPDYLPRLRVVGEDG